MIYTVKIEKIKCSFVFFLVSAAKEGDLEVIKKLSEQEGKYKFLVVSIKVPSEVQTPRPHLIFK